MHPVLFEAFGVAVPSYYVMMACGFLAALYLGWRESPRVGIDPDDYIDFALYMLITALLGSRALHVLADGYFWDYVHLCTDPLQVDVPQFIHVQCATDVDCVNAEAGALCHPETGRCHPARDCFAALAFWQGGLAFIGGLIACIPVGTWFIRKRGLSWAQVADIAAFAVPASHFFGRLGCFLSGCCYGSVTTGPLGIRFKGYLTQLGPDATCPQNYQRIDLIDGSQACAFGRPAFLDHAEHGLLEFGAKLSEPVHATQAYEGLLVLAIFLWVYLWRRTHRRYAGQSFFEYVALYCVGRFVIEFFRDDDRGLWFGELVSTSQLLGLALGGWAVWRLWVHRHRQEGVAPPADPESSEQEV